MEMKEMVYGGKTNLLYACSFNGYDIAIINIRGSHPCAYIRIPDEKIKAIKARTAADFTKYYYWEDGQVHGGFTYGMFGKPGDYEELKEGFWLGWDYAHCGDYTYDDAYVDMLLSRETREKKWTTLEILHEAIDICISEPEFDESLWEYYEKDPD